VTFALPDFVVRLARPARCKPSLCLGGPALHDGQISGGRRLTGNAYGIIVSKKIENTFFYNTFIFLFEVE
jgi:hypothetical protein